MLAAFGCIPHLVDRLGTTKFGLLGIVWVLIGYFSLFDLGLSRAITQSVASRIGAGRVQEVRSLVRTGVLAMACLGAVGAAISFLLIDRLVAFLSIPAELSEEGVASLQIAVAAIPFVVVSSGIKGALEALGRFRATSQIGAVVGTGTFLMPAIAAQATGSLVQVVQAVFVLRVIGAVAYFACYVRVAPPGVPNSGAVRGDLSQLLRFGGWMSVTNVVGPLMVYFDRFIIGGLLSLSAVSLYLIPYEAATRLLVIPTAVFNVLFPSLSEAYGERRETFGSLYRGAIAAIFAIMLPILLFASLYASPVLGWWLDGNFSPESGVVMQILLFGVLCNGLALVPFGVAMGAARPDLSAKLHLAELPMYLAALTVCTRELGIVGAAIAWSGRAFVDLCGMTLIARSVAPRALRTSAVVPMLAAFFGSFFVLGSYTDGVLWRALFGLLALGMASYASLFFVLEAGERDRIRIAFRGLLK